MKIKAGNGGDGLVSFMRLKCNEFAGPDGGDGGHGGHVIFKGDHNLKSLNKISSLITADSGENGKSYHMRGKNADHLIVPVPLGTAIKAVNSNFLIDIESHDQKYIAAHGMIYKALYKRFYFFDLFKRWGWWKRKLLLFNKFKQSSKRI